MSRIYLDACSIIYLAEAASPFHEAIVLRLRQHQVDAGSSLITSRLSSLECRVRPIKDNDGKLLADYDRFFAAARLEIIEIPQTSLSGPRLCARATASRLQTQSILLQQSKRKLEFS